MQKHSAELGRHVVRSVVHETDKNVPQMANGLVEDQGRRRAYRRSLRVQLDRAARQLVRAVRGAVHVLPGRGKLVPGRIIMSKYKSILGVVIMPHRIVQKHVDEIGRHRTDIRVVERRKDITQVPRVLAENENNRLRYLFEMLGDIVR